jgi:hypothetical protein
MKIANFRNSVGTYRMRPMIAALAISLVMVSCGGRGSNQQSGTANTETAKVETTQVQLSDVAKVLSVGGLTESDIKPAGFDKFYPAREEAIQFEMKTALDENQQKAWIKKIFDKCQKLSTDGKLYRSGYSGEKDGIPYRDFDQRYAEYVEQSELLAWAYPYNDKIIRFSISRDDWANKICYKIGVEKY